MGCWIIELSCTTKSSTIREDPLKNFCHVPNYIFSMINLLLPHKKGYRMFSGSGLHEHKQLYLSYIGIIPNSSNVDKRYQLSCNTSRCHTDSYYTRSDILCSFLCCYLETFNNTSRSFIVLFFFFMCVSIFAYI